MRISSESELKQLLKNRNIKIRGKNPRMKSNKTILDGHEFDSKKEADIYFEFKHDPDIEILELQPKFTLIEKFQRRGKTYRAIKFTADFRIKDKGIELIIDVKSAGTLKANSKSYPMRRKLFLLNFPLLIFKEIIFNGRKRVEKVY